MSADEGTPGRLDPERIDALVSVLLDKMAPDADREAMALGFTLFRAANRIQQDLETNVHRPSGITWAAFRILFTIGYAGTVAPIELARLSSVSQASISSVLNTLERYGLIVRERSEHDGRRIIVRLTDAGESALAESFRRNNARERDWAQALSPNEIRQFLRLLHKLVGARVDAPRATPGRLPELGKPPVPTRSRATRATRAPEA